jgi:hypothetical protein
VLKLSQTMRVPLWWRPGRLGVVSELEVVVVDEVLLFVIELLVVDELVPAPPVPVLPVPAPVPPPPDPALPPPPQAARSTAARPVQSLET